MQKGKLRPSGVGAKTLAPRLLECQQYSQVSHAQSGKWRPQTKSCAPTLSKPSLALDSAPDQKPPDLRNELGLWGLGQRGAVHPVPIVGRACLQD